MGVAFLPFCHSCNLIGQFRSRGTRYSLLAIPPRYTTVKTPQNISPFYYFIFFAVYFKRSQVVRKPINYPSSRGQSTIKFLIPMWGISWFPETLKTRVNPQVFCLFIVPNSLQWSQKDSKDHAFLTGNEISHDWNSIEINNS